MRAVAGNRLVSLLCMVAGARRWLDREVGCWWACWSWTSSLRGKIRANEAGACSLVREQGGSWAKAGFRRAVQEHGLLRRLGK